MASPVDPTANTAAYRLIKMLPDTVTGLRIMHLLAFTGGWTVPRGLRRARVRLPRHDGTGGIRAEILRPKGDHPPLPLVVHLHGGGFAAGAPRQDYGLISDLIAAQPCIVVAPQYRRSFQAPFPAALEDCHDVLRWVAANAARLGGRDDQIMVMGESAGGGLTAALCLLARDRKSVRIACQIPISAMLDDRPGTIDQDPAILTWSAAKNRLAWQLYLSGQTPSAYAAPARAADLSGLPPAIGFVGDSDLFCAQNAAFMDRLRAAGVAVEFTTLAGAYHGIEVFAPHSAPGKRARAFLFDAFTRAVQTRFAPQSD